MNQSTQRIIRNKIGLLNLAEELGNDPLFEFCRWKANFRILDVAEVKTVPYKPISHPIVERLIRSNSITDCTRESTPPPNMTRWLPASHIKESGY